MSVTITVPGPLAAHYLLTLWGGNYCLLTFENPAAFAKLCPTDLSPTQEGTQMFGNGCLPAACLLAVIQAFLATASESSEKQCKMGEYVLMR